MAGDTDFDGSTRLWGAALSMSEKPQTVSGQRLLYLSSVIKDFEVEQFGRCSDPQCRKVLDPQS